MFGFLAHYCGRNRQCGFTLKYAKTNSLRSLRNFIYVDKNTFILLYKAMVRPHLEYANSVWCPYKKGDIESIEKLQKKSHKVSYMSKEPTIC